MRGRVQRNKVMKYRGGAPDCPLSMGPECPRYATAPTELEEPASQRVNTTSVYGIHIL